MIQGTGSNVGKSMLVAGLCRLAKRSGLRVAPFKPQNMSNNAAACADGSEIGRAQALQARAAGLEPYSDLNPVLLKPQTDCEAQLVVRGRAVGTLHSKDFLRPRNALMSAIMESFHRLTTAYDLIVVEGAGSPAEVNLRAYDVANMGFARRADVPVCLLGDIDRGGVLAALVGTKVVLEASDAAMVVGFAINKFRGDPTLLTDGLATVERHTGWPCFGVIPWLRSPSRLPSEDGVSLDVLHRGRGPLWIVAPMLSRMANFDDADPLRLEPNIQFEFVPPGKPLPRAADVIILFGTKSTLGDLAFLRDQGWDREVIEHARRGGRVLGLCGGFQMLGRTIHDPSGIDGPPGTAQGLGLLDLETTMTSEKTVRPVSGKGARDGAPVSGYEIHVGETRGADLARPMVHLETGDDGACSENGRVEGTYVHGLFTSDAFRAAWLERVRAGSSSDLHYNQTLELALDELADDLSRALEVQGLFAAARAPRWRVG